MNKEIEKDVKENNREQIYWGYAACFGTAITFIAGIGHVNSFGLIYNDFMINTHSTAKSLTTAHGVFAIMLAIGGIILNVMNKRVSRRKSGLIGALSFCVGSFTTIAITNTNQLPITFGVLQGIGFGIMVPVSYSTINQYYVRKRTTVMSIIKTVQGLLLMWYPQLLKQVIYQYGFRGTLLIISGISLHTFPGMLLMKAKQTKEIKRPANEIIDGSNEHEVVDLLDAKNVTQPLSEPGNVSLPTRVREMLIKILNLKSLKDPVYRNICIGQSFVNFSDLTFFILLPMLLFQYGYDTSQVATCISICAAADVAGRGILAVVSSISHINTRVLFYIATLLTFVFRIVILHIEEFLWVAIVTAFLGVLRAWLHVTSPLVIANHVSHEDFPGAYALFMLAAGLVNVAGSPLIGLLKDIYRDYRPAFLALTVCCLPCLLSWPVEYIYKAKTRNLS